MNRAAKIAKANTKFAAGPATKMAELVEKHHDGQDEQKRDEITEHTATQRVDPRQKTEIHESSFRPVLSSCPTLKPYDAFAAISGKRSRANNLVLWSTNSASSTLCGSAVQLRDTAASSVASTRADIPAKFSRRARNSATATSLEALSTVGAAPPSSSARRASARAGKRARSGSSKVKVAARARSSRGSGP